MPGLILIRGAGDLSSGVALRLFRSGLNVAMTELTHPVAVRRTVAFAEAIFEGQVVIEGVTGRRVDDPQDSLKVLSILSGRNIPVLVDPDGRASGVLSPLAIVDGRMQKKAPEALSHHAYVYIGLGPGFTAPQNCHAVIETERSHALGRVIWQGSTLDDTASPEGDPRRVLRAPADGTFESTSRIGQHFEPGDLIASVDGQIVVAPFAGILRGLLRPGLPTFKGMKVGDIDARDDPQLCQFVSDKSLAIGGGVLEALLTRPEVRSRLWA